MKTDLTAGVYIFEGDKVLLILHRKLGIWLPVGGHIDANETPDQTVRRETKEEVGLEIEILREPDLPLEGNVKTHLALPFYANVHSVGDHDHACFYYIARAINASKLRIKENEVLDARWFSQEELKSFEIPADVRHQALKAFVIYGQHGS